jgi:multidrug efflux pump subunit AcrA (membrane-fusion protein)
MAVTDAEIELEGLKRRAEIVRGIRGAPEQLRAPVDGVIATARVVAGQVVQAQDVLFQIIDPQSLWVEALVYSDAAPAPINGATAIATNGTTLKLAFQGISRALQQQASVVQFSIVDPPAGLSVGQPVTVMAPAGEATTGIIVPRDAVVKSGNGELLVWRHAEPERFEPLPVRAEAFDAAHFVIRAGVKDGERIVVRGAELINQVR